MDFALSEEHIMLRDSTRDLVRTNFIHYAENADRCGQFDPNTIKSLKDLGYFGICLPVELGGAGFDPLSLVIILEEISNYDAAAALLVSEINSVSIGGLLKNSKRDNIKRYLTRMAAGDLIGSIAINESDDNYSLDSHVTRAVLQDNHYTLQGLKTHVFYADLADFFVVSAQTNRDQEADEFSLFIVDKDMPGLTITKLPRMMGFNAAAIAHIRLDNCLIPVENLVGQEGGGRVLAADMLLLNQLGLAAIALGISAGSLHEAIEYSKVRTQFNQPICQFEAIQFMLADMVTAIDAARLLVHKAAWSVGHDKNYAPSIYEAKLFASETAFKNVHHANQIFAGYGYIKEYAIERLFREQLLTELFGQNNDVLRHRISDVLIS